MGTFYGNGRSSIMALMVLLACTWSTLASVNVNSFVVDSPPALECSTITVTVSGTNNATDYIFNGTSFTVSGFNITIDVNYIAGFVITPGSTPFSHGITLGMLPKGTYTVTTNGNLNSAVQSTLISTLVVGSCCPAEAGFLVNDTVFCVGDTAHLTNTSKGSVNQQWYINNVLVASQLDYDYGFTLPGKYDIKLVVDDGSCKDSIIKAVAVNPLPSVNLGNDTTICKGDTLILNAAIPGVGHYSWQDGTQHPTYTVTDSGTYIVTVENEEGCVAVEEVKIGLKDCSSTGFEHNNRGDQLSLFPNPAANIFWLTTANREGTLKLYDVDGRLVFRQSLPAALRHEIQLTSELNNGIYLVVYQTELGLDRTKLTVVR